MDESSRNALFFVINPQSKRMVTGIKELTFLVFLSVLSPEQNKVRHTLKEGKYNVWLIKETPAAS